MNTKKYRIKVENQTGEMNHYDICLEDISLKTDKSNSTKKLDCIYTCIMGGCAIAYLLFSLYFVAAFVPAGNNDGIVKSSQVFSIAAIAFALLRPCTRMLRKQGTAKDKCIIAITLSFFFIYLLVSRLCLGDTSNFVEIASNCATVLGLSLTLIERLFDEKAASSSNDSQGQRLP